MEERRIVVKRLNVVQAGVDQIPDPFIGNHFHL